MSDDTGQKPSQDAGVTAQPIDRERSLLLTGSMRIICRLSEDEFDVVAEAMRQLKQDEMHDRVVLAAQDLPSLAEILAAWPKHSKTHKYGRGGRRKRTRRGIQRMREGQRA